MNETRINENLDSNQNSNRNCDTCGGCGSHESCNSLKGCGDSHERCCNKKTALYEEQFDSVTLYYDHQLSIVELKEKCRQLLKLCSSQLTHLEGCFLCEEGLLDLNYKNQVIDFSPSLSPSPFLYLEGNDLDVEAISELFSD